MDDNAKRVAKNTLALYFRMLFLLLVSLFTVRVVLQSLGVSDYGLYNVVGGFVGLFGFFSGTLTNAAQRYFAIHLALRDWDHLNKTFSLILGIILAFSLLVLVISETAGLWFVINKMTIPEGRMTAAIIVYELSVVSFIIIMIASPLTALLVADENLSIYAIVSVIEGLFKLLIAYALMIFQCDKLILYAGLLFLVTMIVQGFFLLYCKRQYPALRVHFYREYTEYKGIFSYINWNVIGAIAQILKGQGVNIIMNIFFGPSINASRGIAFTMNGVVSSFSQNFMKAVNPQIIKSYAEKDKDKFQFILITASKLSYFLLFAISLPLIFNVDYILRLWLGTLPEFVNIFVILVLVDAWFTALTDPLGTGVQAVGKVKAYQILVGGTSLLNLPISYALLYYYEIPWIPFVVGICLSFMMGNLRIYISHRLYPIDRILYIREVYFKVFATSAVVIGIGYQFFSNACDLSGLVVNATAVLLISFTAIIIVGLNSKERQLVFRMLPIQRFFHRWYEMFMRVRK